MSAALSEQLAARLKGTTRSCSAGGPYEIFVGSWGAKGDPGDNPIAAALNSRPKYVASTTLTDPQLADTTVLSGEVAAAIGEMSRAGRGAAGARQRQPGPPSLFENQLVDEITLLTCPVVVSQGTRLFPDTSPDRALELIETRATTSGETIQVYRPAGRTQYGTATPTPST